MSKLFKVSLDVIAPSKARRLLQCAIPRRVRSSRRGFLLRYFPFPGCQPAVPGNGSSRGISLGLQQAKFQNELIKELLDIEAAASEGLYINPVPFFDVLPNIRNRAFGNTAGFTRNKGLDQGLAFVLIFLVATDEIPDIVAGVAVLTGLGLLFPSGQKTHPYRDINILSSIVCVTMPLYFASNEA